MQAGDMLIIGGGPGGMAAAKYAAQAGHSVELWEKTGRLGGNMNAAGGPDFKYDVRRFSMNLQKQLYKSGAGVRLSKEADAAAIAGKGKLCQNIAEWVVVEIYLAERSGVTVLDDPIAIVKR